MDEIQYGLRFMCEYPQLKLQGMIVAIWFWTGQPTNIVIMQITVLLNKYKFIFHHTIHIGS